MKNSDPENTFSYAASRLLDALGIAYVHLQDTIEVDVRHVTK